ncbi:tRNA threonylcarbamoyladenosine biosynthesis protein TsaE [Streptoalloteichus tenebrarius]|uniref:tRNA threonylcarbamoyladenosine biosynthesis protein TsaE n=1 Tax=Streptoalloteichus tenebrarius (strain ATCC 17920 / DSM 40477 / JCM 4838 / CBS 697.72 / NBRC 16177 / NCIMB 11028 / NRRL B-12390 / A12253. 1 / ISP 5477) TaxID=1933 RepID=A0ABT1HXD8_STRSD|nr:tRNA threonylcarbamoyladenosine biosynthesis protein TsaE [Streptoalloteichus tenebrarius]BFF02609.1 tRNA (adenosine(37)-N6)-threonylcarbamoyltransferase complex ATPase subunit type 1 TsaE [Streptoalloteichus tenebrarius]
MTVSRIEDIAVELPDVTDTVEFGRRLGEVLRAGDLVLLSGPLGAGKTATVRGIAAGMGVAGQVNSPTFVIARVHRPAPGGRGVPLVHVDAYRLNGLDELDDLDLDTDLTDAAVVVEWGEGVAERLSEDHLIVRLDRRQDDVRVARFEPHGESWESRLRASFDV